MEWDLPDHRLEARAQLCVDRIRSNPDLSFPDIFTDPSKLLGSISRDYKLQAFLAH